MLVTGRQPFAVVTGISGEEDMFQFSATLATTKGPNIIPMNPMLFRGRLATIASNYERFVFRRIRFIYSTNQPNNVTGNSLVLGVHSDGEFDADAPFNASELRQVTPSITFPIYAPTAIVDYKYDGESLYYVSPINANATFPSDERLCNQGLFCGYWVAISFVGTTGTLGGYIDIEYECEVYNPTFSQSLVFSSVPEVAEAAMFLRNYERDLREKKVQKTKSKWTGGGSASGDRKEEDEMGDVPPLGGAAELVSGGQGDLQASPSNELLKRLAQLLVPASGR